MTTSGRGASVWRSFGAMFLMWCAICVGMVTPRASLATETVTYYYEGVQGSVLATTDAQGNITSTTEYRPYGALALGTPQPGPGYTGHVNDPDTGLVYMQARYYDPDLGRFLSADPLRPSAGDIFAFGRYTYGANNPITHVDPTGMVQDGDCSPACIRLRQLSDQFSGIGDSLQNAGGPPTAPLAAVNVSNAEVNSEVAQAVANTAATAAPTSDMVPGATVIACESGVACTTTQMVVGVLTLVPGMEEVGEVGEAAEAATTVRSLIQINRARGLAAEAQARLDLIAEGYKVLGSHVRATTSGGIRYIDHLVESPTGELIAIEVKSGNARRNSSQLAKDALMSTEGAVISGRNAPERYTGTTQVLRTIEMRY